MLKTGILNPHILSLLARIRHTNMLVIADRGFPYWPMIETVDISLVSGIPTVLDILNALQPGHYFQLDTVYMAQEFTQVNTADVVKQFEQTVGVQIQYEKHVEFKKRVPNAIGLIRTGDAIQYANMILVSG